jgi:hypothetical protein
MIFTSKHNLELAKSSEELDAFFKSKTGVEIEKKALLENTVYSLENDYNQFILSKKPRPFTKNGILEVHMYVYVKKIDSQNSTVEYSMKYSDLSLLLIVFFLLILSAVILFSDNIRFFGNSTIISSYLTKTLILLFNLSLISTFLWIRFRVSASKLQDVLNELIKPLKEIR